MDCMDCRPLLVRAMLGAEAKWLAACALACSHALTLISLWHKLSVRAHIPRDAADDAIHLISCPHWIAI